MRGVRVVERSSWVVMPKCVEIEPALYAVGDVDVRCLLHANGGVVHA